LHIDSVVRASNGQAIVWIHASAERFVPAFVRVLPLDSGHVVVVSGLEPDQRIVTLGANLLNQIR
jgi:membrane fusion protein, heavy metal efflux system